MAEIEAQYETLREARKGAIALAAKLRSEPKPRLRPEGARGAVQEIDGQMPTRLRHMAEMLYEEAKVAATEQPGSGLRELKESITQFRDQTNVLVSYLEAERARANRQLRKEGMGVWGRARAAMGRLKPDNKWETIAFLGAALGGVSGIIDRAVGNDIALGAAGAASLGFYASSVVIGGGLFIRNAIQDIRRNLSKKRVLSGLMAELAPQVRDQQQCVK